MNKSINFVSVCIGGRIFVKYKMNLIFLKII